MVHFFDSDIAKKYGVNAAVLAWHTLEEALDGEGKTAKVTTEDAE